MKKVILVAALVLANLAVMDAMAGIGSKLYFEPTVTTKYLNGDTTYHIHASQEILGFIFTVDSELEFPLDNCLMGVGFRAGYLEGGHKLKDRARVDFSWATNIMKDAGDLKDSDWFNDNQDIINIGSIHPGLDIYSDSDAELTANILDINFLYNAWLKEDLSEKMDLDFLFAQDILKDISVGILCGYRYQKFEYDVSNTRQVGYGGYSANTVNVSGKTLEYEVEYQIPYIGIASDALIGDNFRLSIKYGYSNWIDVEDVDKHLVRTPPKNSYADGDGRGYLLGAEIIWTFLPQWSLNSGFEYLDLDASGSQKQYNATTGSQISPSVAIHDVISTTQWNIHIAATYRF